MSKWLLVFFPILLSAVSLGLSTKSSSAANANKCVQWNSPKDSYVRNLCNKRIEIRRINGDTCTVKSACDRTILANDVASGMKLTSNTKFIACFYPETDVSQDKKGNLYCRNQKQASKSQNYSAKESSVSEKSSIDSGTNANNSVVSNSNYSGIWQGRVSWLAFGSNMKINLQISGNNATGSQYDGKSGTSNPISGKISNNVLSYNFRANDGTPSTVKIVFTSANQASYQSSTPIGIGFSGTLSRR